jgi:hypothetical protein
MNGTASNLGAKGFFETTILPALVVLWLQGARASAPTLGGDYKSPILISATSHLMET